MQNARELWVPRLCLVQRNPGSGRVWRPSGYAAPMAAHANDATGLGRLSHILVTGVTVPGCRVAQGSPVDRSGLVAPPAAGLVTPAAARRAAARRTPCGPAG